MNKVQFKLQQHLLNSRWTFNMQSRKMFDLDHDPVYAEIFSYTKFRREIMDVSQNIQASIETRVIQNESK